MQIISASLKSSGGFILGIDASNIRAGGGITHLSQFIAAANPHQYGFRKVVVWSGAATLRELPEREWLHKSHISWLDKGLLWRVLWQQLGLPSALKKNGCVALFSPGGTSPVYVPVPNFVMSQNLLPFDSTEAARYGLLSGMRLKLKLLRWSQSRSMRKADALLFLTCYAKAHMLRILEKHTDRIAVIPHGIEERFFLEPKLATLVADFSLARPFRLLYVSIVDMYKHQWQVARAVGDLRRKGLLIAIDFVGPAYPPALQRLQAVMKDVDPQADFLHYLGPVAFPELHAAYQNADAFVFASSCENLPNIILEAMAAGLPIASSNRGPMPEVLGDAGVYFDPESVEEIAVALQSLYESPYLRNTLAQRAYAQARNYSWPQCAHTTFEFISHGIEAGFRSHRVN